MGYVRLSTKNPLAGERSVAPVRIVTALIAFVVAGSMLSWAVAPVGLVTEIGCLAAVAGRARLLRALGRFLECLSHGSRLWLVGRDVRALSGDTAFSVRFRLPGGSRLGGAGFFDGHVVSFCGDRRTHMDYSDRPHKQANSSGKAGEEIGIKAETTSWRNFR